MAMQFPAKVTAQLHDPVWGGFDCWVASTRGLIAFASGGEVHLDYITVRKRANKYVEHPSLDDLHTLGPGNIIDVVHVLRHPDTVADFKAAGYRPPKVRNLGTARVSTVCSYLLQGYQAAVAIFYPTLRSMAHSASGSDSFGDNHSVRWYGAFDKDGNPKTDLSAPFLSDQLDPLCDGRFASTPIGPQRIHRNVMIAEAGDVVFHHNGVPTGKTVGRGLVLACVVKPAQKRVAPKNPELDVRSQLAAALEKIADLTDEHDAIVEAFDSNSPLDAIRQIVFPKSASEATAAMSADESAQGDPPQDSDDEQADTAKNTGNDEDDPNG
jgi:hypothetical protein